MSFASKSASSPRGGPLDALRFAAAFLIVVYHYLQEAPVPLESWPAPFHRGYLATDFFLMLSGYVLARAYGSRLAAGQVSWASFVWRRVTRIWPPHLVVLGGFVTVVAGAALVGVSPGHPAYFEPAMLAEQALLVQAWGLAPNHFGWNTVTWSLSALLVCYAAFPLLWRLQRRIREPLVALALAASALALSNLAIQLLFGRPLYDLSISKGVLRALPLFVLGMALARTAAERPLPRRLAAVAGLGAMGLLALLQGFGRFDALSIVCIGAVILAAGSRPDARPWPAAAYGARLSFALFLTHLLVSTVWFGAAHAAGLRSWPQAAQWAMWFAAFPMALLAAAAFDALVDQPMQRCLNRPRRAAAGSAQPLAAARS